MLLAQGKALAGSNEFIRIMTRDHIWCEHGIGQGHCRFREKRYDLLEQVIYIQSYPAPQPREPGPLSLSLLRYQNQHISPLKAYLSSTSKSWEGETMKVVDLDTLNEFRPYVSLADIRGSCDMMIIWYHSCPSPDQNRIFFAINVQELRRFRSFVIKELTPTQFSETSLRKPSQTLWETISKPFAGDFEKTRKCQKLGCGCYVVAILKPAPRYSWNSVALEIRISSPRTQYDSNATGAQATQPSPHKIPFTEIEIQYLDLTVLFCSKLIHPGQTCHHADLVITNGQREEGERDLLP